MVAYEVFKGSKHCLSSPGIDNQGTVSLSLRIHVSGNRFKPELLVSPAHLLWNQRRLTSLEVRPPLRNPATSRLSNRVKPHHFASHSQLNSNFFLPFNTTAYFSTYHSLYNTHHCTIASLHNDYTSRITALSEYLSKCLLKVNPRALGLSRNRYVCPTTN